MKQLFSQVKLPKMSEFEYTSTTGIPSSEGESIYLVSDDDNNK